MRISQYSQIAQSVEQVTVNHRVGGSSPSLGALRSWCNGSTAASKSARCGLSPSGRVVSLCDSYLEHRVKYLGNVVQFYTRAGQAKRFNSSSHKLTFGCGFESLSGSLP